MSNRVVVGMTGASGQIYGIRTLELLNESDYSTHLVMSKSAKITLKQETEKVPNEVEDLADRVHHHSNIGAEIASGSFETDGMIITPCSMKTLSNIASGNADNLINRSADVTLKERNPLILMPREKPYNRIHISNMMTVTDAGGIIFPPFPSFYQGSTTFDEMISRTVSRGLSLLDIEVEIEEWSGLTDEGE